MNGQDIPISMINRSKKRTLNTVLIIIVLILIISISIFVLFSRGWYVVDYTEKYQSYEEDIDYFELHEYDSIGLLNTEGKTECVGCHNNTTIGEIRPHFRSDDGERLISGGGWDEEVGPLYPPPSDFFALVFFLYLSFLLIFTVIIILFLKERYPKGFPIFIMGIVMIVLMVFLIISPLMWHNYVYEQIHEGWPESVRRSIANTGTLGPVYYLGWFLLALQGIMIFLIIRRKNRYQNDRMANT